MKQRFKYTLRSVSRWIIDALFPQFCGVCKKYGKILCASCQTFLPTTVTSCPSDHEAINEVFYLAWYSNPAARTLIHSAKYAFIQQSAQQAGLLLAQGLGNSALRPHVDVIIPIPLHPRRFAERGFNQATLLARPVADFLGVPLGETLLIRAKVTAQQATLSDTAARARNVHNGFIATGTSPRSVLLIDDVYTSGATCAEAARTLKAAGAEQIYVLVLAKG